MHTLKRVKIYQLLVLLIVMVTIFVCLFISYPVFATEPVQPAIQASNINQEDRFTEVAGSGQSISAERNQNGISLIIAGLFGLTTLGIIAVLSHLRWNRKLQE